MPDDEDFHWNKSPSKTYVSPVIQDSRGIRRRYVSKVFDSSIGFQDVVEKGRTVLRVSPSGRQEVIAKIYEGDREVYVLTI